MTMIDSSGIRCPVCHGKHALVLSTRNGPGYVRRRHVCLSEPCQQTERRVGRNIVKGVRWTTYEFFSPRPGTIHVPRDTRAIRGVQEFS